MRTFLYGIAGVVVVSLIGGVVIGLLAPDRVEVQHRRFIAAEPPAVFEKVRDPQTWVQAWRLGSERFVKVVEAGDGEVGSERTFEINEGGRWVDMVSALEEPYVITFSGLDTRGAEDLHIQVRCDPGAQGGTVASLFIHYTPAGFFGRIESATGGEFNYRHGAQDFLQGVAELLGVEKIDVDTYVLEQAQARAREQVADEAAAAAEGAEVPAEGGDDEGEVAAPSEG